MAILDSLFLGGLSPLPPPTDWPQNGVPNKATVYFRAADYGAPANEIAVSARVWDAETRAFLDSAPIDGVTQIDLGETGVTRDVEIGGALQEGIVALDLFCIPGFSLHRIQFGYIAPFFIEVAAGGGLAEDMRVEVN